jgi:hypothetical protein
MPVGGWATFVVTIGDLHPVNLFKNFELLVAMGNDEGVTCMCGGGGGVGKMAAFCQYLLQKWYLLFQNLQLLKLFPI